ncbi:MAG TPA: alpha/beta hydrolase [Anaerolineales bacterium]|nr:alpha/beta hydrolase [Anaerolineales bacterium]
MRNVLETISIPETANYIYQGTGTPVILIHGLAASLYDWEDLIPELTKSGYAAYAPDLLGHGDSPKMGARAYQMDWIFEHFSNWMKSLRLTEPAILIGHSMGGHVALEYARRVSAWTRGLVLVNPFYSRTQLPFLLRNTYGRANLTEFIVGRTPEWLFRFFVDMSSLAIGHGVGALRSLPQKARVQTILDYKRTAPGIYHVPNVIADMTEVLHEINTPTLVVWGDRDKTLSPASFPRLVSALPKARGEVLHAGHVPHQSHAEELNQIVMKFLKELP